jgi:hypothetical protein
MDPDPAANSRGEEETGCRVTPLPDDPDDPDDRTIDMSESRETKEIVKRVAAAIRAASLFNARDLRSAAAHIRDPEFSADANERAVARAFTVLLEHNADRKERILRETFAGKNSASA